MAGWTKISADIRLSRIFAQIIKCG